MSDLISHFFELKKEILRHLERINDKISELEKGNVVSIKEREVLKSEINQVKELLKDFKPQIKESESALITAIKSPVIAIGIIAICLIIMVIELINKDTGGIIKPYLQMHNEQSK